MLVDEVQEAESKRIVFNAGNLPGGVYTYRITAGTFNGAKKMMLVK